eukprot:1960040-Rhodomonas_salina.1
MPDSILPYMLIRPIRYLCAYGATPRRIVGRPGRDGRCSGSSIRYVSTEHSAVAACMSVPGMAQRA